MNIVINDHSIRYLELKQANPPIAYKWGERLLPAGIISNGKINDYETLSMILEECITEWKIRKRQVRFLIPEFFVIIRKVTIPANVEDDEIKGYLYLELGSSIHLPFEEPVFDAVVLSSDKEKKEILIFAAQEENVMEYSDLFSDLKLDPIEAEISPLALYRLYDHLDQTKRNEDLLVVQFDLNTVNICIFENHIPFFMHHLPVDFDEEQWKMNLNKNGEYTLSYVGEQDELNYQLDDIYKEINRLMDFYRYSLHQGKKQVSKILLNGDHPMIGRIKKDLRGRFAVPLETISYEEKVPNDQILPHTYYLALGLALKGV
ncbi:pilus assembly protein PilM [Bacillus sp. V3B]|uniref:type IV pilus biogenesis protein PilM n=1 Tax=Bacillus sp. V3B TaxID=2804915 RepID=UPI00210C5D61|nr:pilus assembly protein PilM [Bacillus sp. V3B]